MKLFTDGMTYDEQLDAMKTWPDGWNSYSARAPRHTAIERARVWLHEVQAALPLHVPWIEPLVCGEGDGGVSVEVWHGTRKLSLGIDEQEIAGICVWGETMTSPMTDIEIETLDDAIGAWVWLYEEGEGEGEGE